MGKINLLDKKVSSLIAAGEVVERPASAVKELVENSIDAGARSISVEIRNGGVSYIRVSDDGCGMEKEDLPLSILRHATSKIRTAEDLETINTLGFRGEALAALASAAKLEIISRNRAEDCGTRLWAQEGRVLGTEEAGCPPGTTVVVRDLFYNTPARMKFLKKDSAEAAAVASVIERLSVIHPDISFRFIKDGKDEIFTPGDGDMLSAIYSVYGREVADGLLKAEYEHLGARARGFVGKPSAARTNRNLQLFYVNGRHVVSKALRSALEEAYRNEIQAGRFPVAFLELLIDPSLVDVNVHPAKIEVKFADERAPAGAVYFAAKNAMHADKGWVDAAKAHMPEHEKGVSLQTPDRPRPAETGSGGGLHAAAARRPEPLISNIYSVRLAADHQEDFFSDGTLGGSAAGGQKACPMGAEEDGLHQTAPEGISDARKKTIINDGEGGEHPVSFRLIGELFSGYILVEHDNSLVMIDKHAAHERVIFDSLRSKERHAHGQLLLEPMAISLSREEIEAALENRAVFEELGFLIEEFGSGALLVRQVPVQLDSEDVRAVIGEVCAALERNRTFSGTEAEDKALHSIACRAAVKMGDRNAPQELESLVRRVLADSDIKRCPHGRPVAAFLTRDAIEKLFRRKQ